MVMYLILISKNVHLNQVPKFSIPIHQIELLSCWMKIRFYFLFEWWWGGWVGTRNTSLQSQPCMGMYAISRVLQEGRGREFLTIKPFKRTETSRKKKKKSVCYAFERYCSGWVLETIEQSPVIPGLVLGPSQLLLRSWHQRIQKQMELWLLCACL